MPSTTSRFSSAAIAFAVAFALLVPAGPSALAQASGDPGVARISDVEGGVDVHRSDASGTYAAALNAPVSVGDYIETNGNGRAEVEFDHATVLRVASQTQLRFTHLTPDDHTLQLGAGTVELRLFRSADGHPDVQTPGADVRPTGPGRYRVTVDGSGNTVVDVRSGNVDVATSAGTRSLVGGQAVAVDGNGGNVQLQDVGPVAYDAFDGWGDARDGGWSRVSNWNYVDSGMVGENDLSDYGQWTNDPQYGQVWQPTGEPSGWSPYSDGQWVWEPYYGWTWVGDEPWGYAPYHYGRWFNAGGRWCWAPGAYDPGTQYYGYQPAVVGFFGLGAGIGIGFAIANVGWVPLAPGEAYHPWWRGYGGNYTTTTVNNYTYNNTYNYYRNARYPGGALAVGGSDFANGNFRSVRRLNAQQLRRAQAFTGVVPVVPTARNLAFAGRANGSFRAPRLSPHFARMAAPAAVAGVAFAKQRTALAGIARKQYPRYASSVARQVKSPAGHVAGFARPLGVATAVRRTNATAARKPNVASRPKTANVFDRFGAKHTAAKHVAAKRAPSANAHRGAPHAATVAHGIASKKTTHAYVAPKKTTHAYVAPKKTTHAYVPPKKTTHAYVAPKTHAYVAPKAHAYAAPRVYNSQPYTPPVHHAAPAARPATVRYAAPAYHPAAAARPAPVHYAAPVQHAAPAHAARPALPAHGGGGEPHEHH